MFDVKCNEQPGVPKDYIELQEVGVRGDLGDISIYCTPESFEGKHDQPEEWERIYHGRHAPARELVMMKLETPIRLAPGQGAGLYVHSELQVRI